MLGRAKRAAYQATDDAVWRELNLAAIDTHYVQICLHLALLPVCLINTSHWRNATPCCVRVLNEQRGLRLRHALAGQFYVFLGNVKPEPPAASLLCRL